MMIEEYPANDEEIKRQPKIFIPDRRENNIEYDIAPIMIDPMK